MKTLSKFSMVLLVTAITILALSGCTGPAGVQGPTGQQGPAGPAGPAGVSITGASVNSAGHLVLTLSNGQTIDAGSVIGPQGRRTRWNLNRFCGLVRQHCPSSRTNNC